MDALAASLRIAATGLYAQGERIRVASENMANANSTGATPGAAPYARRTISFDAAFDDALQATVVRVRGVEADPTAFRLERDPSHPAADAAGMVKTPKIDMLVEMADIREANRSYEANLQVVKRAREMLSLTVDLMRT
ncbi:MAG: flagellar basal body rod protein FlgC [Hyphomicrobiales bacterium]|nr:flagellar basal body rod protein FlgC [Hyphomicrobiales bacterium]